MIVYCSVTPVRQALESLDILVRVDCPVMIGDLAAWSPTGWIVPHCHYPAGPKPCRHLAPDSWRPGDILWPEWTKPIMASPPKELVALMRFEDRVEPSVLTLPPDYMGTLRQIMGVLRLGEFGTPEWYSNERAVLLVDDDYACDEICGRGVVLVPAAERPHATQIVQYRDKVLIHAAAPMTAEILKRHGFEVSKVETQHELLSCVLQITA